MNQKEKKYIGLSGEYKKFNKSIRHLRKLSKDTFQAINNVIECENLSAEQVSSVSVAPEEVSQLHHRLNAPLTIVVTGQHNYGKAAILTALLGTRLLPFSGHTCCATQQQVDITMSNVAYNCTNDSSINDHCMKAHQLDNTGTSSEQEAASAATRNTALDAGLNIASNFQAGKADYHQCMATPLLSEEYLVKAGNDDTGLPIAGKDISDNKQFNTIYEKPWRGIRITYSASPITYSVVRPGSQRPSCQCELETESSYSTFSEEVPGQHFTTCSLPDVRHCAPHEHTSETMSHFKQDQCLSKHPMDEHLTVTQLEDLLESKFQTRIDENVQSMKLRDKILKKKTGSKVKEVPLSELELDTHHLQDPILRDALLDIGLNHCLLKEHVQVMVTPTIDSACTKHAPNLLQSGNEACLGKVASEVPYEYADVGDTLVVSAFKCDDAILQQNVSTSANVSPAVTAGLISTTNITVDQVSESLPIPASKNQFYESCNNSTSPSLKFGTPMCSSITDFIQEVNPLMESSLSSSLESFKSLPTESYQNNVDMQSLFLPKFLEFSQGSSYFASRSLHDLSSVLLSNVSRTRSDIIGHSSSKSDSNFRDKSTKRKPFFNDYEKPFYNVNSDDNSLCFGSPPMSSMSAPTSSPLFEHPLTHSTLTGSMGSRSKNTKWMSTGFISVDDSDETEYCLASSNDGIDHCELDSNIHKERGFMATILPNITAMILYAITKDHFTKQDISELAEIRKHSPSCPVMFIHVPPVLAALQVDDKLLADIGILPPSSIDCAASPVGSPPSSIDCTAQTAASPVICGTPRSQQNCHDCRRTKDKVKCSERNDRNNQDAIKKTKQNTLCRDKRDECLTCARGELMENTHDIGPTIGTPEYQPMVFSMDNVPMDVIEPNRNTKPASNKLVTFSDETVHIRSSERLARGRNVFDGMLKRENVLITSGNCSELYTEEGIGRIRKKSKELFELTHTGLHYPDRNYCFKTTPAALVVSGIAEHTTNRTKSAAGGTLFEADWCKISDNMLHVLTEELGFFKSNSYPSGHVSHCHLPCVQIDCKEQVTNPFVNSYKRTDVNFDQPKLSFSTVDDRSFLCGTKGSAVGDYEGKLNKTSRNEPHKCQELCVECRILDSFATFASLRDWTKSFLRGHVAYTAQLLSKVQGRCLSSFVVFAFEFSRHLQITPRRLSYARQQEAILCQALLDTARHREDHIRTLIIRTLLQERSTLLRKAENCLLEDAHSEQQGAGLRAQWESAVQECVLKQLNHRVGEQLVSGVQGLRDQCLGTLKRCLRQLEEDCCREQPGVTHALKLLVNAAYQVEVRPTTSWGLLRGVWERVKVLLAGGSAALIAGTALGTRQWKRQVAADMINSLSERRLAKSISAQVCGEIRSAHLMFLSNLSLLEHDLTNCLASTEHKQQQLRAVHAPKLARLALHTDALYNRVHHGLPVLSKELGRGHFGVVYSCRSWGGYSPCAVKTLLPRDSAQWKDIALQYHYTRLMGYHDRVVSIHACLIDKYYGDTRASQSSKESNQCVLLVMDVHTCDLDAAIRRGLGWGQRFRIAVDVVQGIRFLHSKGLIHRDIKPKNVVIDSGGRAKITDLDFCKPAAMITGSVVGTPIHMAPELFTGTYDNSVDVYAFGVLFWYLCSGKTNMPNNFCLQKSKEDLKNAVFKGVRPEYISTFSPESWSLMEKCWAPEPRDRVLLGTVEEKLTLLLEAATKNEQTWPHRASGASVVQSDASDSSDDSALD